MNRKTARRVNKNAAYVARIREASNVCVNCGGRGLHYVPPSLGDLGFFTCTQKQRSIA